jgi:dTDP-4-dehydrorhamnose reductase
LQAVFERFRPTVVLNSAAMTQVDLCETERERCKEINVKAVHYLCGLCKEYDARLVQVSTDFIFDGQEGPYKETDTPNPLSVYGHSKLEAEKVIANSGIPAAIVRTVLVYGTAHNLSRSNIVLWVKSSLEAGKVINVVDDQFRSPTLAEDLADGILAIVFRNKTGIFHISGGEILSVYDLALRVAKYFELDTSLVQRAKSDSLTQAAPRPPKTGFIILKAQTELDYQPLDLETGLSIVARQLEAQA